MTEAPGGLTVRIVQSYLRKRGGFEPVSRTSSGGIYCDGFCCSAVSGEPGAVRVQWVGRRSDKVPPEMIEVLAGRWHVTVDERGVIVREEATHERVG